ncbi:MAG: glycosyltransferase [Candidatus Altiarchaeota archaeon]
MQHRISFIIPIGPGLKPDVCVKSIRRIDYPKKLKEVIVAQGRSPSKQRNEAVRKAKGDIVYFLDDDVIVAPDVLEHFLPHFGKEGVAAVGGPMITPEDDPLIARCFGYTMESYIGAAGMRYRFKPIGDTCEADETRLVLCNLTCRRDVYLNEGGLRPDLFPNEENEFFNRLASKGHRMIYEPRSLVYHSRASTILGVIRKNVSYGRGRMEQMIIQPTSFKPVFAMPSLFAAYLLSAAPVVLASDSAAYLMPLLLYLTFTGLESLRSAAKRGEPLIFPIMWLLYPTIHVSYGAGFVWGLLMQVLGLGKRGDSEVKVSRVNL